MDHNLVRLHHKTQRDHRRLQEDYTQSYLSLNVEEVESVNDMFLGKKDFSWSINTSHLVKKAQQRLVFLRKMKQARLPTQLLVNFYHCTIESILACGGLLCSILAALGKPAESGVV